MNTLTTNAKQKHTQGKLNDYSYKKNVSISLFISCHEVNAFRESQLFLYAVKIDTFR